MNFNFTTPAAIRFMAWSVAVATIGVDQLVKSLMRLFIVPEWESKLVVLPVFNLVHYNNTGMGFGIFAGGPLGNKWVLMTISLVITLVVVSWLMSCWRLRPALAYGFIIGGALGNVIDRLLFGEVFDFLQFHWGSYYWPAFNVADMAIVLGVGILFFDMFCERPALPKEEE